MTNTQPTITFSSTDFCGSNLTTEAVQRWREFYTGPYAELHSMDKDQAGEWFDEVSRDWTNDRP